LIVRHPIYTVHTASQRSPEQWTLILTGSF
jgi:hypothetical protein